MNINGIISREICCGCSACSQVCNVNAISFVEGDGGFMFPIVDAEKCIDCGRCIKSCPVSKTYNKTSPIQTWAAYTMNEEARNVSSSGGAFYELANAAIKNQWIVIGAAFDDNWKLKHVGIIDISQIGRLQGSKYIQSDIDGQYKKVKNVLAAGKGVMFVGTPCQVAGLKSYLGFDYDKLLMVDFCCKGVASAQVFHEYIEDTIGKAVEIDDIEFRKKTKGWNNYHFYLSYSFKNHGIVKKKVISQHRNKNPFMRGYLQNLFLRSSCYHCPFRESHQSDIALADFWGIERTKLDEFLDDKGVSAIHVNTDKGQAWFEHIRAELYCKEMSLGIFEEENKGFVQSPTKPLSRDTFFNLKIPFEDKINLLCNDSRLYRVRRFITQMKHGLAL